MKVEPAAVPLRILHLEDNPHDSELVGHLFAKAGIDARIARVDSEEKFSAALEEGAFDLILSDYSLPSLDGLVALQLALNRRPEKPFILFSGTIGEEAAVDVVFFTESDKWDFRILSGPREEAVGSFAASRGSFPAG